MRRQAAKPSILARGKNILLASAKDKHAKFPPLSTFPVFKKTKPALIGLSFGKTLHPTFSFFFTLVNLPCEIACMEVREFSDPGALQSAMIASLYDRDHIPVFWRYHHSKVMIWRKQGDNACFSSREQGSELFYFLLTIFFILNPGFLRWGGGLVNYY